MIGNEKHDSFQSSDRKTDISIVKFSYALHRYLQNDYICPIGSYKFHFLSGAPPERNEYLTLVYPFDSYTWALIIASLVGVTVSLILIDNLLVGLTKETSDDNIFRCKKDVTNFL